MDLEDHYKISLIGLGVFNLYGIDKKGNYYWGGFENILVTSKYGEILDCFKYEFDTGYGSVDQEGNVYLMNILDDRYNFYCIKNVWDPIDSAETIDLSTPPKALSITATSFIDWKNTYTPTKAFDGNLNTGWLEAAKGPGTGESITLKLDRVITVDEIRIAPGYFDPKWWKSNNRVKSLKVFYGITSKDIHFKDEMKTQEIKLSSEAQFSEITFEISSVYPSRIYNDAGISEIEFYYKGEKVEIDVSGVK